MTRTALLLLMFAVGGLAAVQPLVNARLALKVGGFLPSACVSFAVGAAVLTGLVLAGGRGQVLAGLARAEWWELLGGVCGAIYVSTTIVVFPRVGTAAAMAAIIASQLSAGLILDHLGAFGFRQIDMDWQRLLGVGLLLAGAMLVYRP